MKKILLLGLVTMIASPSITFASIDGNLKYGAIGGEVNELQDFLITKGFLSILKPTDNFFSMTLKAVIAYQGSVGLPTTGFVGPMTRTKINEELSSQISASDSQETAETGTSTPPIIQCPIGFTCTKDAEQTLAIQNLTNQVNALKAEIQTQTQIQTQIAQNTAPRPTPTIEPPPTISIIGETQCQGDKIILPFTITGKWVSALTRIYTENVENIGGVDMRSSVVPANYNKYITVGNTSDLSTSTSGYGRISDNPYLNGRQFRYEIKVYDGKYLNNGGNTGKLTAETSGDVVIKLCN